LICCAEILRDFEGPVQGGKQQGGKGRGMKAIRVLEFGEPECMKLEVIPDLSPGPGQVVVKIMAAGVNPVDTYVRSGTYQIRPTLPYTPGTDAGGVVESVGQGVEHVTAGDRVYTAGSISGTYAESALCDAKQIHLLPQDVSYEQGAGINIPYSAAFYALFFRARAVPEETVLVHGATGGVGIAAVQLASASGMSVIGTGGTDEGRALVLRQGAQHVLDHHAPDLQERILSLTKGKGVDVILEMLANVNLGKDLGLLAQNGRVVVIGSRGPVEINPRDAMMRSAAILGMLLMNASEGERSSIHAALSAGLRNGILLPVVGKKLPLADATQAHHLIMKGGTCGKIVLIP
jgi:NADPH2:quinone reductase